jgi:hypothetical protein
VFHTIISHSAGPHDGLFPYVLDWLTSYSSAIQAFNALAIIVLTVVIIVVTIWQSRTARKALVLEWYPELYAEIVFVANYTDAVEVTNLGRSTALILSLRLRPRSGTASTETEGPCKKVVRAGESAIVPITAELRKHFPTLDGTPQSHEPNAVANRRFEISFSFYSSEKRTDSKWFDLPVGKDGHTVREP